MVLIDEILGKCYKYIWLTPIVGSILVLLESILNFEKMLDAGISIGISIIIIIFVILSRFNIHGSGIALGICSYFLLLSPIGFTGFNLGHILILVGSFISISGGLFSYTNYFLWVGIGAVVVDLIIFFALL
ncbi:MAG: hypothetical protein ACFFD2_16100 [Promethearchaeota archaeon]